MPLLRQEIQNTGQMPGLRKQIHYVQRNGNRAGRGIRTLDVPGSQDGQARHGYGKEQTRDNEDTELVFKRRYGYTCGDAACRKRARLQERGNGRSCFSRHDAEHTRLQVGGENVPAYNTGCRARGKRRRARKSRGSDI